MAMEFFSDAWCEALMAAGEAHRTTAEGEARLLLRVDGGSTPQLTVAVAGGSLVESRPVGAGRPTSPCTSPLVDAWTIFGGGVDGTEACVGSAWWIPTAPGPRPLRRPST